MLVTGTAGVSGAAIEDLQRHAGAVVNYLTDDPWSPNHRAGWFLRALRSYTLVATTRRRNMEDLQRLGCSRVSYLPFAYDPAIH